DSLVHGAHYRGCYVMGRLELLRRCHSDSRYAHLGLGLCLLRVQGTGSKRPSQGSASAWRSKKVRSSRPKTLTPGRRTLLPSSKPTKRSAKSPKRGNNGEEARR